MKLSLILGAVLFHAAAAQAANITIQPSVVDAKVNAEKGTITLTLQYGGGCGDHEYSLELDQCQLTFPVQCSAKVWDETNDLCDAFLTREWEFDAAEFGLTDGFFSKGLIKFRGSANSNVTVQLPESW